MARTVITNYENRKLDILTTNVDVSITDQIQNVPLSFGDTVRYIAGVQQAAQAFLAMLLTKRSSVGPNLGTDFLTYLIVRQPRTESDIRNYYLLTAPDAVRQINTQATESDERIVATSLVAARRTLDTIDLTIQVETESGETASVLAPITLQETLL